MTLRLEYMINIHHRKCVALVGTSGSKDAVPRLLRERSSIVQSRLLASSKVDMKSTGCTTINARSLTSRVIDLRRQSLVCRADGLLKRFIPLQRGDNGKR
jgi:hypothetical protein